MRVLLVVIRANAGFSICRFQYSECCHISRCGILQFTIGLCDFPHYEADHTPYNLRLGGAAHPPRRLRGPVKVITYQLIIVATIWIVHRLNPRYALWAAVAWSAETLILLTFPPLILIQLGVVWGTYFVLNSSAAKTRRIGELEQQLRDHSLQSDSANSSADPLD